MSQKLTHECELTKNLAEEIPSEKDLDISSVQRDLISTVVINTHDLIGLSWVFLDEYD